MEGQICQSCERLAMLYWNKTWCLRENEMMILGRIEKAIRTICECKLIEKRGGQELVDMLGLEDCLDRTVKAIGMQ